MIRAIALSVLFCGAAFVWTEKVALAAAPAECSRASLQATVDQYLTALQKGDPSLLPLAPQATYMENRNEIPFGKGIWLTPLAVDFNRSQLDVETCQTFTEIIHTSGSHPYVIGTRLEIEDNRISEIESLVADQDDWLFNARDYLKYTSQENWDILSLPKSAAIGRPCSMPPMRISIHSAIILPSRRCPGASRAPASKEACIPIATMIRMRPAPSACPRTAMSK